MKILPITSLSKKDRVALSAIYNKNFPLSVWSEEYFLSFLSDFSRLSLGFCIKQGNRLAGFILGRLLSKKSSVFCLSTLWVDSRFRGKGHGKELVQKLIPAISSEKETRKIILHFRDSNDLENYYSRLGFSGHKIKGAYSNGDLKHYMELKIN